MSELNEILTGEPAKRTRGPKRVRRNYQQEARELECRIKSARAILRRLGQGSDLSSVLGFVTAALEVLEGD